MAKKFLFFALSFLFSPTLFAQTEDRLDDHIEDWSQLLHHGRYISENSQFYLSSEYDPKKEWELSLKELNQKSSWICKFPARAYLISMAIEKSPPSYSHCEDFLSFQKRAPADQVSIVYVSEKMQSPESGFGHSFLKIEGNDLSHTFSFWTKMNDVDPLRLILKTFITGKKGYFTMAPFSETSSYYIEKEGRNLWEYQLELTQRQKTLLYFHLYELKNTNFQYLFHGHNCSTLIREILKVAYPDFSPGHLWATPKDVIKELHNSKKIDKTIQHIGHNSFIRVLNKNLQTTSQDRETIKDLKLPSLEGHSIEKTALYYHLAKEYTAYEYSSGHISYAKYKSAVKDMNKRISAEVRDFQITIPDRSNPLHSQQDTQINLSYHQIDNHHYYGLGFLPVSHKLHNINLNYESEFQLGGFNLLKNVSNEEYLLQEFNILKIKVYQDYDPLIGGTSFQFDFGVKQILNRDFRFTEGLRSQFGLGRTYSLFHDLDLFALTHLEAFKDNDHSFLREKFQFGLIIREVYNMKSIIDFQINSPFSEKRIYDLDFIQSFNFKNINLFTQLNFNWQNGIQKNSYSLNTAFLF